MVETSLINNYTEKYIAISLKSYEVETILLDENDDDYIEASLNNNFPSNLQYVDSFVDRNTGMSGVANLLYK